MAIFLMQTRETMAIDAARSLIKLRNKRASSVYDYLNNFDLGSGSMPAYEYITPEGRSIKFDPGMSAEIMLDNNAYSSLNANDKAILIKWLNHFIRDAVNYYVINYNL